MAQVVHPLPDVLSGPLPVRQVDTARPLLWLRRGWEDLKAIGRPSLAFGLFFAVAGWLLLALAAGAGYLVPALIGGFLLVAPFAAIGLYALSLQREAGQPPDLTAAAFSWRRNTGSIALYGLMLALGLILWERVAAIVFALSYGGTVPNFSRLLQDLLFSGAYTPLLLAFFAAGALFALMVFSLSVVTGQVLLDRPLDLISAALTSMQCVLRNPGAMLFWAALLALLTAIGFATAMIGLIVIYPWLAHASWHAYRDLVER
jgi:uncharacterized membrane protein